MGNQVEYGIRISVSGNKASVDGINEITQATTASGDAAVTATKKTTTAQKSMVAGANEAATAQIRANEVLSRAGQASQQYAAASAAATQQVTQNFNKVTMSAAATAAAMRNVPAQFTDIITSLQGGQSPMTVFMQQGGQLKDMFGGMGNAAKALGGYVLGLINPLTVGAAAVGVLAYACYQGSKEVESYQRAIIMTGNVAGVTADQLSDMAAKLSQAGKSTKGDAAEALVALVSTGNVASENLEKFAAVSVKMQKIIGISVSDTAKDLAELGRSPLEASKKLSEQYHYLTKDTYDQIKALLQHGKTAEAAAVAQAAYINSFDKKSEQIRENLGTLERGWNSVRDGAKSAWDAMLDIGRKDTDGDKLKRVQAMIASRQYYQDEKKLTGNTNTEIYKNTEREIALLREQEKALKAVIDRESEKAAATGKAMRADELAQKQSEKFDTYVNAGSRQTKAQALIEEAKKFDEVTAGMSKTSESYRQAVAANALAIKDINEKFKEKNHNLARQESGYQSLILTMKEKLAASQAELAQSANLTEGQKLRIKFDTDLREGKIAATAAQRDYARSLASQIDLNNVLAIAEKEQGDRTKKFKEEFAAKVDASFKMVQATDAYIASLAAANEQAQLEVTLLGKTETERKIAIEQFKVELGLRKQIKEIENSKGFQVDKAGQIQRAIEAASQRKQEIVVEVNTEEIQKARKELDAFLDPAKAQSFGDALAGAFGTAGNALQKLSSHLQEYARTEAELAKARANAELGKSSNPIKYAQDMAAINERSARAQINNYANITGAAKSFFAEGTRGYKALEAAENAFRIVQLASDLAKGMSAAVVGIASQAQGDPYTAIPRMAAMAAVMASLGFATGFFGSGGSGGGMSAAEKQKQQGTGSVYGDLAAKSESITKSIEEMSQTSSRLLPVNQGMLAALKNIESSMAGFTNLVVRDKGVIDGSNLGIRTGTISRGSKVGDFFDSIPNWLSAVTGGLVGLVGSKLAGWIGGLWGKTTQNVVDSGVQFGGRLSDLQAGKGFGQYASVDTTTSSWFGLKKNTSNSVQSQALSTELSSQLGLIFSNMSVALKEANKALGGSSDEIIKTLDGLTLTSSKVSLKGLSGQALTDALNGVVSKSLDEMAQAAFPQYDKFRQVGEGYAQTVLRIANHYAQLDDVLQSIGTQFGAVGHASVEARERLIGLMGGIETLSQKTDTFAQTYLTEAERLAPVAKRVAEEMAALGKADITTRQQFKDAVLGLANSGALATEAGAKTYAGLMNVAEAFAQVHPELEKTTSAAKSVVDTLSERRALQDQLDQLTMNPAQLRAKQRNNVSVENQDLFDQVQATLANKEASEALAAANKQAAASIEQANKQAAASIEQANQTYQREIDALIKASLPLAQQRALESQGMAESTLQLFNRANALKDEAQAALEAKTAAENLAATQKAAAEALASTNAGVQKQIDELLDARLNVAQLREKELVGLHSTTAALKNRLYVLQDETKAAEAAKSTAAEKTELLGSMMNAAVNSLEATAKSFHDLAKSMRNARDELLFGSQSGLSGVQKLALAKSRLDHADVKDVPALTKDYLDLLSKNTSSLVEYQRGFGEIVGRLDSAALDFDTRGTAANSADAYEGLRRFAEILAAQQEATQTSTKPLIVNGSHANGLDYVPFDGYIAELHQGERVLTANEARSTDDLIVEMRSLRSELKAQTQVIAKNTADTTQMMKRWENFGMPAARVDA